MITNLFIIDFEHSEYHLIVALVERYLERFAGKGGDPRLRIEGDVGGLIERVADGDLEGDRDRGFAFEDRVYRASETRLSFQD